MHLLYFASLRDELGRAEERVSPPPAIARVSDLLAWLRDRDPAFAAFDRDGSRIRVAVNQRFAVAADPVGPDDEIALFPPVTGG